MRARHLLLLLSVVVFGPSGFAAPTPPQAPGIDIASLSDSENVIERLYSESSILGLAQSDHDSFAAFLAAENLIASHGNDPDFKFIVIETFLSETASLAKRSVAKPVKPKFARENSDNQSVWNDWLIYAVQKANVKRKSDPILVVAIDSMTVPRYTGMLKSASDSFINRSGLASPNPQFWRYAISIAREKETALNFKTYVLEAFPGRKGLIVYHHAHILKNLTAVGSDQDEHGFVLERAPLGWIGFAAEWYPGFSDAYRVVLFDQSSAGNPQGVLRTSDFVRKAAFGEKAFGALFESDDSQSCDLTTNTFLSRYRYGTVRPTAQKSCADAVIYAK
jgi:hypothetical protein